MFKPFLACDWDEDKVKFPLYAMPKVDGVRALSPEGKILGRSLKRFDNPFLAQRFDGELFKGFDGELALGEWTSSSLCRDTTGFVNRKTPKPGKPVEADVYWWIFDDVSEEGLPYRERYSRLQDRVEDLISKGYDFIRFVPMVVVHSVEEILLLEKKWLEQGFEGVILRDPDAKYKNGRSTVNAGGYLRIKRFADAEAKVVRIVEAMENQNEAKTNELGRTERSSHQENMVPKGMVGSLICEYEGEEITVGAGEMDHSQRIHYFINQHEIIGKTITFKTFLHGKKDKPRFPVFKNIRSETDISEV
jgi:DNA ligase-1